MCLICMNADDIFDHIFPTQNNYFSGRNIIVLQRPLQRGGCDETVVTTVLDSMKAPAKINNTTTTHIIAWRLFKFSVKNTYAMCSNNNIHFLTHENRLTKDGKAKVMLFCSSECAMQNLNTAYKQTYCTRVHFIAPASDGFAHLACMRAVPWILHRI